MGKTIGLLTTGFWHSFSRELFHGVRAETERRGMTLVTFLGNELQSKSAMTTTPELANSLYRLISTTRLDGLVVWTGNLGNYVTRDELEAFVTALPLPLVTIGRKIPNLPNIFQDEERRAMSVMDHLLEHGARRILFLSGPATHVGCQARQRGYRKSIEAHGLTGDDRLIFPELPGWESMNDLYLRFVDEAPEDSPLKASTPKAWLADHSENIDHIFLPVLAERGLVPGRDFDAVLGATDLLAAIAIRQLNRLGTLVPSDVRVAGLDGDPMAGDILAQALSTQPLNLAEQGVQAVDRLVKLWEKDSREDVTFEPGRPAWGTTCGCLPESTLNPHRLSPAARERLRGGLAESPERFLTQWIRETKMSPPVPGRDATDRLRFLWDLELSAPIRLQAEIWVQQAIAEGRAHASQQRERKLKVLFDIGQSLSTQFDRASMSDALLTHLPRLGLAAFSVSLFADPQHPENGLQVLAARLPEGRLPTGLLASDRLAPDAFFERLAGHSLVIEPLYFSGGLLGLLILEHEAGLDLEFYHHVGTQISVAIKGTLLKEEVTVNMETLNQAQVTLREKEKMAVLGGLAAGVVHEVNTPLGAIISVNTVLESLTAGLPERTDQAAPFLAPIRADLEQFLESLPRGWAESKSRPLRRALVHQLILMGASADHAELEAGFLVEHGFTQVPEVWGRLVSGKGADAVFRLIETLADIRRTAAVNRQASTKMENYLKAIKSYIYRDRDHTSAALVDVCQTLDTVLTLNSSKLNKTVSVERRYASRPVVEGWSEALIQVWNNLVSNSLFAMGDAGVLKIDVQENDRWVAVAIEDTGPGIPEAIQMRIFEDFFTTKPIGIGTGLGLGIVRQVIHDHRGTITFASEPGRTVFTVRLPRARVSAS